MKKNVFIYPMLSIDRINGDSNYVIIKKIVENILEKTDDYNFLLLLDKNRQYIHDLVKHQNIKILFAPFVRSKKRQVIHFNTNILWKIYTTYPIDIIWNNVVEQGHNFKYFDDGLELDYKPKVFNYHHWVIHRSLELATYYKPMTNVLYQQIMGSLGADLNYFQTQYCQDMLLEEARDILHPKKVEEIKAKSVVKLGGYSNVIKSEKKHSLPTFIYNHRLAGYKNWKYTFELFDELNKDYDFRVYLASADKNNTSNLNDKPYISIKQLPTHDAYIKELSMCHYNTLNSEYETYCLAIAESIMNNQVVIVPKGLTFTELLPDDYPYFFSTKREQSEILKHLLENDIREYKYKPSTIKRLTLDNHVNNIMEMFSGLMSKELDVITNMRDPEKRDKIIKGVEGKDRMTTYDINQIIRKVGLGNQAMCNQKVKMMMGNMGWDFNMQGANYYKT